MPPRRRSRKRRDTDSPEPLLSLRPTPSPPPELADQVDEASPPAPPPEALSNLEIVRNILLFVDNDTLRSAFTVSTAFYTAAGPLLHRHVSLTSAEAVLKILNLTAPARTTRGHAKKTMTPLPFFKHTVALTVGFHVDPVFPRDWMDKLKAMFPLVRQVKVEALPWADCRARTLKCQDAMWDLPGRLTATKLCLAIAPHGDWSRYYIPPRCEASLTSRANFSPTAETLSIELRCPLLDDYQPWTSWLTKDSAFIKNFERFEVLVQEISHGLNSMKGQFEDSPRGSHALSYRRQSWTIQPGRKRDIAEKIASTIGSSRGDWTLYFLGDFHPKESTIWPAELKAGFEEEQALIEDMLKNMMDEKYKNDKVKRPIIHLRIRLDYMKQGDRYVLSPAAEARMETLEKKKSDDHRGVTGMYGTWDVALKQ